MAYGHHIESRRCLPKKLDSKFRLNQGRYGCRQIWMPFDQLQITGDGLISNVHSLIYTTLKKMDILLIYAIAAGALFGLILIMRAASFFLRILRAYSVLFIKYLLYPQVLRRHRFFGPWTRAQVLSYLLYLAVKIFCSTLRVSTVKELSNRTGTLSLINMIPAYFGYHLSFVSDVLGLSIIDYRRIHASTGIMSVCLGIFHAIINAASVTNLQLFSVSGQLFGFIVCIRSLCY